MSASEATAAKTSVRLMTPAPVGGAALAIIQINSQAPAQLEAALARMNLDGLEVGSVSLRLLPGGDRGLVARWLPTCAQLFPHGGQVVLASLRQALIELGFKIYDSGVGDPQARYPEASDLAEACALCAIARAASPRAIDQILEHRDRWQDADNWFPPDTAIDNALNRLIHPPLVVLIGPPNVGKSTLTNGLARRAVSIASDEPGTTRDHVGVMLELDGLTVRWIDAPGLHRAPVDAIEEASATLARRAAERADLIVLTGDAHAPIPKPGDLGLGPVDETLRLGLRSDLGQIPGSDLCCSARSGTGLVELGKMVRQRLVPDEALQSDRLWRFDPGLPK
jgi:tRNA modification GTPase